jgi:opacity protein-like surface antigen
VKFVFRSLFAALLAMPLFLANAQVTATAPVGEPPQYTNRWDFYGGLQYSHFNPSPARSFPANNLLGWNGTATAYFRPVWGIEGSFRGLYGTIAVPVNQYGITNPKMSENLFLFGPTFRLLRRENYAAGVHTLIGAAYGSFDKDLPHGVTPNQIGVYNNKLAFGMAWGGWLDYNLSHRLSVRLITDWQPTHYGYTTQNEFAGSVGVVYKIGSLHK